MIDLDALCIAPCHATFGESVTYYPGDGPAQTMTGVYDPKFAQTSFSDGTEVLGTRTVLNVRSALFFGEPVKGELFRIRGILYVVNEVEPDGFGDIRCYLGLASDAEASRAALPPV